MPRIGIGLGLGLFGGSIDAQAQAHYNRVIADGGVVPAGVSGTNAFFNAVKTIYATSDITTAISVGLDAHYLGYKLGAGSGTTLGQAAQKLYSCAGSSGDVVQTTAASQPLLLDHSGANYYYNKNASNCSCSATKSLTQTDTLELIIKIDLTLGSFFGGYALASVDNSGTSRQFYCIYNGTKFELFYGAGIAQTATASTTTTRYNGWLKVTLEKSGINSLVKFYKSEEYNITDQSLVTFTQIGTTITGVYAAMTTVASKFNILSGGNSSNDTNAICYYAQISETIGGSPLSVFNPNQYTASTSQTQWTSTTGEVWTINTGTATSGYKGALVDRTIVQSDGVDDTLAATIAISGVKSGYWAITRLANAAKSVSDALVGNRFNLYSDASTSLSIYTNTSNLASSGLTRNILSQFAVVNNGASSSISKNDGTKTTGTLNDNTLTGIKLFNGADGFANFIINTHLISKIADSNAQQTAMYNYIRTINNNAF